ncbi:MAG: toll/interleukin-1 receptor domain-containing protein [Thiolinea sp.]
MTDIFISYSHKDELWKDELQKQLRVLQLHGEFSVWDDRQIEMGKQWLTAIEDAIAQAKVAILLVSSDFLTSSFVAKEEIPRFCSAVRKRVCGSFR